MTSGPGPLRESRDSGALLRENAALRAENLALRELCHANARALRQAAKDRARLDEILGSRAWTLVRRARRLSGLAQYATRFLPSILTAKPPCEPVRGHTTREWREREVSRTVFRPSDGLKVSVVVPNYNHAPYLDERLRSLFAQTHPPHEILFLDDASSDESVAVARRLAAESPVPFRLVLNESNGGSTFRQWLKGIDLASGDLIWIAESDDTCRPELLERLVPQFEDPEVMLAYCQSAMIGPDGRPYAPDYLALTEDLSPVRWRYPYRAAGPDEVELALSQRNTIPNASAVVFRRPAEIEERGDLESLRLAGDWLFYAMRIRRGKIAYVPEPLNGHRHHDRTVRNGFERAPGLFEEQLRVKARIFESFPVTATAISGSMARGFAEYADRMRGIDSHPPMTEHPRLASHLDRLRAAFRARVGERPDPRVLIVLSGVTDRPEHREIIRLANSLVDRCSVILCNAVPDVLDPAAAARIDERIVLLEGTLGRLPWSEVGGHRPAVIRELIRFHEMGGVQTQGPPAEELLDDAGLEPAVSRLVDLGSEGIRPGPAIDARQNGPIGQSVGRGVARSRGAS